MKIKLIVFLVVLVVMINVVFLYNRVYFGGEPSRSVNGEEVIKLGFITPLTGPFADWGESIQYGLELGLEDANHKFDVDYQDSSCDPKETVNIATKFFNVDDIRIIIGPGCITGLRAIAPIADDKNALLFSTGLLDDEIFREHESVINLATQISTEADYMADIMKSDGLEKVAMVHGISYFGQEYARRLPESIEDRGIVVSSVSPTELELKDFRTVILRVMKDEPEGIFIHQAEIHIGLFAKQLRELGYSTQLYGLYATESQSVLDSGGEALEGMIYTFPYNGAADSKEKKAFEERYVEKYGETPTATSLFTYDGILLIDKALDECDSEDVQCITEFFGNLKTYDGISGRMNFNEDGSLDREFEIKQIKNGEFVEYRK